MNHTNCILFSQVNNIGVYLYNGREQSSWHQKVLATLSTFLGGMIPNAPTVITHTLTLYPYESRPELPTAQVTSYAYYTGNTLDLIDQKVCFQVTPTAVTVWLDSATSHVPLTFFLELLLMQQQMTFIHGIGIAHNNKGVLFPVIDGIDTTALTAHFLKKRPDIRLIGSNFVVASSDGTLAPYSEPLTIRSEHKKLFSHTQKSFFPRITTNALFYMAVHTVCEFFGYNEKLPEYLLHNHAKIAPKFLFAQEQISEKKYSPKAIITLTHKKNLKEPTIQPLSIDATKAYMSNGIMYQFAQLWPELTLLQTASTNTLSLFAKELEQPLHKLCTLHKPRLYQVCVPKNYLYSELADALLAFIDEQARDENEPQKISFSPRDTKESVPPRH